MLLLLVLLLLLLLLLAMLLLQLMYSVLPGLATDECQRPVQAAALAEVLAAALAAARLAGPARPLSAADDAAAIRGCRASLTAPNLPSSLRRPDISRCDKARWGGCRGLRAV
jgi:hypothetical protein